MSARRSGGLASERMRRALLRACGGTGVRRRGVGRAVAVRARSRVARRDPRSAARRCAGHARRSTPSRARAAGFAARVVVDRAA
ncbi:hypothetical protein WI23_07560 [Burkholderia oklahomensis C6786]|nr:hypothetical protein WI23_07560 [Burkholderia oklahomensis C6786]KUY64840.1 hypothetical protein WI23_06090 [Burkholderia oklahomensis C6786]